jgi:lysozyme
MDLERTKAMIRRHEGLILIPAPCPTGHMSIGYARNLDVHGGGVPESITLEQAEAYLDEDVQTAIDACSGIVFGFEGIGDARQAVLIDMAYNLGGAGLSQFVNMLSAIRAKEWNLAALAMANSRWAIQTKGRAIELALMMKSGEWYGQGSREIVPTEPS